MRVYTYIDIYIHTYTTHTYGICVYTYTELDAAGYNRYRLMVFIRVQNTKV